MSEREELEAVIQKALLSAPCDAMHVPDIDEQVKLTATTLLSSGYTKGNGELVEAVRESLAYFELMNVTGSLPDQCRKALSDSEGEAPSGGDAGREALTFTHFPRLTTEIGRMASTGNTGNVEEWGRFIEAVDAALNEAARSAAQDTQRAERATNGGLDDG